MIRFAALALLFSTALTAAAAAQTVAPSATPTNGAVGSAAQRNGYPAVGRAVSLPSIANSSTTTTAPLAGTTSSPAFLSSPTSTSATGVGLGGTGQTGGSGGAGNFSGGAGGGGQPRGGAGSSNLGGGNTAGVATATVPSGSGANWVICPPNGAPGLEPLFTGTDLSCAPQ